MEAKLGIESIEASLESIKVLTDAVFEVLKDGKVSYKDIKEIPGMVAAINKLAQNVKGIEAEAKDLDPAELKKLVNVLRLDALHFR